MEFIRPETFQDQVGVFYVFFTYLSLITKCENCVHDEDNSVNYCDRTFCDGEISSTGTIRTFPCFDDENSRYKKHCATQETVKYPDSTVYVGIHQISYEKKMRDFSVKSNFHMTIKLSEALPAIIANKIVSKPQKVPVAKNPVIKSPSSKL